MTERIKEWKKQRKKEKIEKSKKEKRKKVRMTVRNKSGGGAISHPKQGHVTVIMN